MPSWTLDSISWQLFDPSRVEPATLKVIKAAALVEINGEVYAQYLSNVFGQDPEFCVLLQSWARDEFRHGQALRRWAEMADEDLDFDEVYRRFMAGSHFELDTKESVFGSRSGELLTRCIVEVGTSSWYSAIADETTEPVLKEICRHIAADEVRHYKLFYTYLQRYMEADGLGRWARLKLAARRMHQSSDDTGFAYYAANCADIPYDREACTRAYWRRAYAFYRQRHIERVVAMLWKALGFDSQGVARWVVARLFWRTIRNRARRLARLPAPTWAI
jgi:rubrerythrin